MNAWRSFSVGLIFSIATFCVQSAELSYDNAYSCDEQSPWFRFNTFSIKQTFPMAKVYGLWQGTLDNDSGDAEIGVKIFNGQTIKTGKLLMVSGVPIATQGDIDSPGDHGEAFTVAGVQHRFVFELLSAALPRGPESPRGTRKIDYSRSTTDTKETLACAHGFVAPPWHLKGSVKIINSDAVEYRLALTSDTNKELSYLGFYNPKFSGVLSRKPSVKIDDATSLSNWTLLNTEKKYKTVGDARKQVSLAR